MLRERSHLVPCLPRRSIQLPTFQATIAWSNLLIFVVLLIFYTILNIQYHNNKMQQLWLIYRWSKKLLVFILIQIQLKVIDMGKEATYGQRQHKWTFQCILPPNELQILYNNSNKHCPLQCQCCWNCNQIHFDQANKFFRLTCL